MTTSGYIEKETVPKLLQVYIRRSKQAATSLPANPVSNIADLASLFSLAPVITNYLSLTIETCLSTSYLDLLVAHLKKQSLPCLLFQILFLMIV